MKKLEIKENDLKNNLNIVKKIIGINKTEIIAVVKANGMGLGLVEYSNFLIENEVKILAVANFEEAITLRKANIENEIILLSPIIEKKELKLLIENDITLTISSLYEYNLIEEIIKENERNVKAHLKIDTGFGRYGFLYNDIKSMLQVFNNSNIEICGAYTHFSKPINKKLTTLQFNRFMSTVKIIIENGYNIPMLHCCSSTAFLEYPDMWLDAIRIGSVLQGRTLKKIDGLVKIGKFKTNIVEIKNLPRGYNISYGNTYKLKKDSKIAIIPVGYMDGLNRNKLRDDFSFKNNIISIGMEIKKVFKNNNINVRINEKNFKIIGRLGMYHAIIDITNDNNIKIGDEVELNITPLQTNDIIRREYI